MRPYAAFLGLIFALIGCATHHEALTATPDSPAIVISLVSIQVTNDRHTALFEMKNVGDTDMWFIGWQRDDPLYSYQQKRLTGGWDQPYGGVVECGNCALDLNRYRLASGTTNLFSMRFWPKPGQSTPFRVGVDFSIHEYGSLSLPTFNYWSDTVYP